MQLFGFGAGLDIAQGHGLKPQKPGSAAVIGTRCARLRGSKDGGLYTIVAENDLAPDRIQAEFLTSAPRLADCPPPDRPEVAFAGRSNAGKSSVLNQLTRNKTLARTSKTPGRTQLLNFFRTDAGGLLVDLPGYGYAKAAKTQKQQWQAHLEDYLARRLSLVGLVLVMDIRHPFQAFDLQMIEWAKRSNLSLHLLLNKADKLKYGAQVQALREAQKRIATHPNCSVQLFSASSGQGREECIALLYQWLQAPLPAH